ncbi:MAG TPA: hypothetical protein VNR91_03695 [Sphingomonas sp.]|nr:hypothetical protein [Sphingomonas sp.]
MLSSSKRNHAMIVERPRESDAIGAALREAYSRQLGIPDDLADLLRQLSAGRPGGDDDPAFSCRG